MGSKRHRREVKLRRARTPATDAEARAELFKDHSGIFSLGLFAVLRKRLIDHRRPFFVVVAAIAAFAGLMLANVGFGLNLNSRFWKLAGRLPGADKVSRSAVLANLITAPDDQLANLLVSAKQVMEEGRTGAIVLDETLVLDAGSRAVSAAQHDQRLAQIAWQTASAAISYGSALRVSFRVTATIPDCLATKPQWVLAKDINETETVIPIRPIYSSCRLNLDMAPGQGEVHAYENGFTCRDCVVTYRGAQLGVSSPTFTFERSAFVFSINSEPPPDGRVLSETLLASKFTRAKT
jgi:hypothetical protein